MERIRKIMGAFLIFTGFLMLILLAMNFETRVFDVEQNPMYQLVQQEVGESISVSFNGNDIVLDKGGVFVISMVLTFLFLSIWLQIGWRILTAGTRLFSSELDVLTKKIDSLMTFVTPGTGKLKEDDRSS